MASSNSLLIAPPSNYAKSHLQTSFSAPSAPGIHDTLRASVNRLDDGLGSRGNLGGASGASSGESTSSSSHPLSARLALFPQTQRSLHLTMLRRHYGMSAPLIREMELGTVRAEDSMGSRELALGPGMGLGSIGGGWGRSVHEEVLLGRDCEIDGWEDIFGGGDVFAPVEDFHSAMERRLRMNW